MSRFWAAVLAFLIVGGFTGLIALLIIFEGKGLEELLAGMAVVFMFAVLYHAFRTAGLPW